MDCEKNTTVLRLDALQNYFVVGGFQDHLSYSLVAYEIGHILVFPLILGHALIQVFLFCVEKVQKNIDAIRKLLVMY